MAALEPQQRTVGTRSARRLRYTRASSLGKPRAAQNAHDTRGTHEAELRKNNMEDCLNDTPTNTLIFKTTETNAKYPLF
eukprot:298868-Lingulodinium_polyedra.AAC.1